MKKKEIQEACTCFTVMLFLTVAVRLFSDREFFSLCAIVSWVTTVLVGIFEGLAESTRISSVLLKAALIATVLAFIT